MSRSTIPSLLALIALLSSPVGALAQAADSAEPAASEELQAYREARARYEARQSELEDDTRRFIDERELEVREKATSGYDSLIGTLSDLEVSQRQLAQDRFESFLARYPSSAESDSVRFRLADVYFEQAQEVYLDENAAYSAALATDDLEALEALDSEPLADYSASIALYEQIVKENLGKAPEARYERLDAVYVMLGYCYSAPESKQVDYTAAMSAFRGLIAQVPESELSDRAHLQIGNFLFDDGKLAEARAEYQSVYDRGPDGPKYDDAIYQLAWTSYKNNDFNDALTRFVELLDRSEVKKAETGKPSNFAPDAVKFMAFSLNDLHDRDLQGRSAADLAKGFFTGIGERPYEWDVYVALADVLTRYSKTGESVVMYEMLQTEPRFKTRPSNPEFQAAVVDIYAKDFVLRDEVKAGEARLQLTERYKDDSEWYLANRNNPEALSKARAYIEENLTFVAYEHYVRAEESGDAAQFALAAEKFQDYMEKFPIADDYYEAEWMFADASRRAGKYEDATPEYVSLIKTERYHPYGDGSLVLLTDLLNERVNAELGGTMTPPVDPKVERTYTTAAGKPLDVYVVEPVLGEYIKYVDRMMGHTFTEPSADAKNAPDVREYVEKNRPGLMYNAAQALFFRNRYDEARPRLEAIIAKYPRTAVAEYSASLLLDSYTIEGDLEKLRQYAQKFATMALGESGTIDAEGKFANRLEETSFKLAKQLGDAGDADAAAEAFLQFRKDFPKANEELRRFSLYNAAFYLEQVGRVEEANRYFEQYVNEYATHETSKQLYFRIASNYEASFDLEKAIEYYDRLVKFFPDHTDAPLAVYNSAFLRVGLGRFEEAAQGFERYARDYPNQADRESTHYRAGQQYLEVSDAKAQDFYQRYLKQYGYENPDHALEAMAHIGAIYDRRGDKRAYERQQDEIIKAFEAIVASGKTVNEPGRDAAASARMRYVEQAFLDLTKDKLTGNETKDAKLLAEDKPKQLGEFQAMCTDVVARYASFEAGTRAEYLKWEALLYFADLGLAVRPPKGLSEDDEILFLEVLEEKVYPAYYKAEDDALVKLNELVDFAKRQKRYSASIALAQAELNKRRPSDYPAVKRELLGEVDSSVPVVVSPLAPPKKVEETAPKVEEAPVPVPPETPTEGGTP